MVSIWYPQGINRVSVPTYKKKKEKEKGKEKEKNICVCGLIF